MADESLFDRRDIPLRAALMLALILVASLVTGGRAIAATTAPTFVRTDHEFIGNNHIVGDFNGDGSLDLAGTGFMAQAVIVRLNNGAGYATVTANVQ